MEGLKSRYEWKRGEILFVIAFSIFMFTTVYELTAWSFISDSMEHILSTGLKLLRYGAYALCMVKILIDAEYKKNRFLFFGGAAVLIVLSYLGCLNQMLVLYVILFMAVEGISSETIIKVSIVVQSFILVITVGMSQLGITEDIIWDPNTRPRHFLGFAWVTTASILFLFILLEYIYLRKGRINILEYVLFLLVDAVLYKLTDARMAFYMSVVFLSFFFILGRWIEKGTITVLLRKLMILVPEICFLAAVFLHVLYSPNWTLFVKLNDFLSGRLKLGHDAIETYGFSLFGTPITWLGYSVDNTTDSSSYNYVDCSYLQIMLEYGFVVIVLIIILYSIIIKAAIKNKKYYLCWIIAFIMLFCITEPRLIKLAFNPFLLLCVSESGRLIEKEGEAFHGKTEIYHT